MYSVSVTKHFAWAVLSPGACGWKGAGAMAAAPGIRDNMQKLARREDLPETWEQLLAQWRVFLGELAEEFMDGDMRVEPLNGDNTCRYCHGHMKTNAGRQWSFERYVH